jgi:hypothetical protein
MPDLSHSPWLAGAARAGLGVKGVVYLVVGGLAVLAAAGAGGRTTGSKGAFQEIGSMPLGTVLLGVVCAGLFAYAVWRFCQAGLDLDHVGGGMKGWTARFGMAVSGIGYAVLGYSAARVWLGDRDDGVDGARSWSVVALAQPMGAWLLGIIGLVLIGVGIGQVVIGVTGSFQKPLHTHLPPAKRRVVMLAGRIGFPARGLAFGLIGGFLVSAAVRRDPSDAHGLGQVLAELAGTDAGPWLLGAVALGLMAYGLSCWVEAFYRQVTA